jgi:hypothetical protein
MNPLATFFVNPASQLRRLLHSVVEHPTVALSPYVPPYQGHQGIKAPPALLWQRLVTS